MKGRILNYSSGGATFICVQCLLAIAFLMFSCGTEEDGRDSGKDVNNVPFLQLSESGLHIAETSSNKENYAFPVTIKRIGTKNGQPVIARLTSWNGNELENFNREQGRHYTLLPSEYYTVTPQPIEIGSEEKEVDVNVSFNPAELFSLIKESGNEYAIALRLESDDAKVTSAQCDLILGISLNYPRIGFASDKVIPVNMVQEITSVEIPTRFAYTVDGNATGSPWGFTCKLSVPENAEELITRYNTENHTAYRLLPQESYQIEGLLQYEAGATQVMGNFTVDRKRLSVDDYLLPLTITDCSHDAVLCDDVVQYVSFSQTYSNPVFAESHADPTVIRADDGFFYLYATESGGRDDGMGIYRSADLIHWEWAGQVLHNKFPSWSVKSEYDLWAPEIRKIGNQYVIYYSVAKWGETKKCKIGVANAPSPTGPFYDKGEPLITYEESGVDNCIDPFYWEENGKKYLFWGSFKGLYVTELTADGLSVKKDNEGKAVFQQQVAGKAFEATCIYKKDNYYYLFASVGSCCEGANSSYRVVVGRSTNLFGPYVDKNGGKMLDNKYELVLQGNSLWAGPGHNSQIVTDDAGTEWMIYHGYQKNDPDLGRLVLLDRLQWTEDGWPYIKGKEPSEKEVVPVFYSAEKKLNNVSGREITRTIK